LAVGDAPAAHAPGARLQFYRGEYVVVLGDDLGLPGSVRANFVRGADGRVAWFSSHGRLYARRD
jgi:hypothetical protein